MRATVLVRPKPGILDPHGDNTIALAVTTDGEPANALESMRLVVLRAAHGGASWGAVKGLPWP